MAGEIKQDDRIWQKISELVTISALNEHKIKDLNEAIQNIRHDIGALEGKYDTIIQMKIDKSKVGSDRSFNIKLALLAGSFAIAVALIEIIPNHTNWLK